MAKICTEQSYPTRHRPSIRTPDAELEDVENGTYRSDFTTGAATAVESNTPSHFTLICGLWEV